MVGVVAAGLGHGVAPGFLAADGGEQRGGESLQKMQTGAERKDGNLGPRIHLAQVREHLFADEDLVLGLGVEGSRRKT